jgi:hypothetical protein
MLIDTLSKNAEIQEWVYTQKKRQYLKNKGSGQFQMGGGHSYVSVVVFTDPIKEWSIFPLWKQP